MPPRRTVFKSAYIAESNFLRVINSAAQFRQHIRVDTSWRLPKGLKPKRGASMALLTPISWQQLDHAVEHLANVGVFGQRATCGKTRFQKSQRLQTRVGQVEQRQISQIIQHITPHASLKADRAAIFLFECVEIVFERGSCRWRIAFITEFGLDRFD